MRSSFDGAQARPTLKRRALVRIYPGPAAFEDFDGFTRSVEFLEPRETDALIVAGDEIVDNLLTHGEIGPTGVTVLVRKRSSGVTLAFFIDSHSKFAQFSSSVDSGPVSGPRFDPREGRWRGLGLTMCRNLASSISYRPGLVLDRIFLAFKYTERR